VIQKNILVDVGMRQDFHSEYGEQFNPTASVGYLFSQSAKIFISSGRSFRAPSYTELYYSSRSRIGNENLKPETGWSYELGVDYVFHPQIQVTTSLFERDQENLIDYVQYTAADTASRATNFTKAVTRGVEIAFRWKNDLKGEPGSTDNVALQHMMVRYTYLDSRIDVGNIYSSLYSFIHPRHQLNIVLSGNSPLSINITTSATHKIKLDGTSYTLIDAKLSRLFSHIDVFIQGTNLLNKSYEEIVGVPLPGRWLWAGVEFRVL
jgi:iron complex outermembrane receptor protein